MPNVPAVSVVLTVYNRERYVAEAIESILAQTLADFELIIVDDGSSDNSPKVIADHAKRDSRIIVVTQKNAGAAAARNAGVKKARAELITFMDDDDISLPTRLEKQFTFLCANPVMDCGIPWMSRMDESGNLIRTADSRRKEMPPIFPSAFRRMPAVIATPAMIRKRAFEGNGGLRAYFKIMIDFDFTLRFLESGRAFGEIGEDLYRQRIYPTTKNKTNLTGGFPLLQFKYAAAAIISAHCRRAGKRDPIDENPPLDDVMKSLADLTEVERAHLMRFARNCARRILRGPAREDESSDAQFWEMIGHISAMSAGLERRANAAFRWLLWRSLRYGRFSVAARLIKNFAFHI